MEAQEQTIAKLRQEIAHLEEQYAFMGRRCLVFSEDLEHLEWKCATLERAFTYQQVPLWRRLYLAFFPGAPAR